MQQITLMDGSIGQELVRRSGETPTPLWSTSVMLDRPQLVQEVHEEYLDCGATIISTNTYPVLYDRLEKVGLEDQLTTLWDRAIEAAKAAKTSRARGRIAGSLGPLGASYRPDLAPSPEEAAAQYAPIVAHLTPHVDVFLAETVSSFQAAKGILRATDRAGIPVWLAVSVADFDGKKLRSGEPLEAILPLLESHRVDALLINCSRPEDTGTGLDVIANCGIPFGAFANGFTKISKGFLQDNPTVDALDARVDLGPEEYTRYALEWIAQGASIVGGCCEIGPAHIRHLHQALQKEGFEIV